MKLGKKGEQPFEFSKFQVIWREIDKIDGFSVIEDGFFEKPNNIKFFDLVRFEVF